ncbi:MAG TPA: tetraacyldisaccharide 4'-kinase [Terriglobales bacterium]|nr:tetraacyldisaccharide 4'-kinase [Terriglobales bacterium]
MSFFSAAFGAGVRVRNRLYDRGTLRARSLHGPTISVGNLSVGGAGKTPFVILLGQLLQARGIAFDVLSRGYGRTSHGVAFVDPQGSPREFGDEPLLIARNLGVPVVVGEDRYSAGVAAEQKLGLHMHLLDDGFQHRALARDFDIVLITGDDLHDKLLPAGRLREPLAALRRADAVVLSSAVKAEDLPLEKQLVWRTRRDIVLRQPPVAPVAFCAIARPKQFFLQLRFAGCEPAAEAAFRDHHAYTDSDIRDLLQLRERCQAGGFVTTEKDGINLGELKSQLQPLAVVPVKMELVDAAAALDRMFSIIAERNATFQQMSS